MHPDHDLLEQQLWELLYGLLPEGEAASLRERIAADPAVAAAYARVAARRELVAEALRWSDEEVLWKRPQEETLQNAPAGTRAGRAGRGERRGGLSRVMRAINVLACTAAAMLLAVIGYAWLNPNSPLRSDAVAAGDSFAGDHVRLIVSGPREVSPSAESHFTLTTATLSGLPRPAEIAWRFRGEDDGPVIAQGRTTTGANGRAVLAPPAEVAASGGRLEVEVSEGVSRPVSLLLSPGTVKVEANLLLAKRFYAPGEAVLFRAQAVTPEGLAPDPSPVRFKVVDPAGEVIEETELETATVNGVAAGEVQLPADALPGRYTLAMDAPVGAPLVESSWFFIKGEAPGSSGLGAGGVGGALGEAISSNAPAPAPRKEEDEGEQEVVVTLEAGDGRFEAGAPVTLEVVSMRREIPVLVAATSGEELVGQSVVLFPQGDRDGAADRQSATIELPEAVAGRLRLIAYDYSHDPPQALADLWVFRAPSRFLNVQIEAAGAPASAGGEIRYDIQVADESGKPAPAVLGVAVVETEPSGNGAEFRYFADRDSRRAEIDAFARLAAPGRPREQGAEAPFSTPYENVAFDGAAPVGEQSPLPEPPQVADNLTAVWEQAQADAAAMAERRAEWRSWLGRASLGGGALLLIVLLITGLLRIGVDARVWTPALAASLLLVGIGGSWLSGERSLPAPTRPLAFHTPSPNAPAGEGIAAGDNAPSPPKPADAELARNYAAAADEPAEPVLELERLAGGSASSQSGRAGAKYSSSGIAGEEMASGLLAERKPFSAEARSRAVPDEPAAGAAAPQAPADAAGAEAAPPAERPESLGRSTAQARKGRMFQFEEDREVVREQDAAKQFPPRPSTALGLAAPPADESAKSDLADNSLRPFYSRMRGMAAHPAPGVLYWNPRLETNREGRASVEVSLPTPLRPHRVVVEAHLPGRAGRAEKEFRP